ncbi:hypothetical protein E4U58_003431 [Claviceps cyperi]|nr:hypothetical protein E4U58_003431 [Claviceps cyperi]
MDIDSGTRPLLGLGGTNVESVAPKFETIFSAGGRVEGYAKARDAEATRVRNASAGPQRPAPNGNTITIENLDRSVEKAVQKALRVSPTGGTTWASGK